VAQGSKSSGSEKRKRGPIIGFRATEEERAQIAAAADRAGLTVGSYVRAQALKKPTTRAVRRPPVQTAQLAQLLGLIGAAGGSLQQIAQRLDDKENLPEPVITASLQEFRDAAAAVMRLMGKRAHDH
jgi:hypothetical protein